MNIPKSYAGLRALSKEELIAEYDKGAAPQDHVFGPFQIREEIARLDAEESTKAIVTLTKWMTGLTVLIALLTLVNVVLVWISLEQLS